MLDRDSRWLSFHLYHHGELDRLLTRLVLPLVSDLRRDGFLDRLFFVRYWLGGPHVRLRIRSPSTLSGTVCEKVVGEASRFFREQPSADRFSDEHIAGVNRSLLAQDPNEHDDRIYPNNSVRQADFEPEVERYGGQQLLEPSLDFFTLSSLRSLEHLGTRAAGDDRPLSFVFRLLLRHGMGFSRDERELCDLFAPASEPELITERARQAFEDRRDRFLDVLRHEIDSLTGGGEPSAEIEEAESLASALDSAPAPVRRRILLSQLHMSCNRLGLRNAEELYLAALLRQVLGELQRSDLPAWSRLAAGLAEADRWGPGRQTPLPRLIEPRLDRLAAGAQGSGRTAATGAGASGSPSPPAAAPAPTRA